MIDPKTNKMNGTCSKNTSQFEYMPTYVQFPGELCDQNRAFYECGFGYRKCLARRCYGFLAGEACVSSADCNPHLYCDKFNRTCQYAVAPGELCYSSDMCDMGARCKFDSSQATSGKCIKYFSLPTGSRKKYPFITYNSYFRELPTRSLHVLWRLRCLGYPNPRCSGCPQFPERSLPLWQASDEWESRSAMQDLSWLHLQCIGCFRPMRVHILRHSEEMWHSYIQCWV